MFNINVVNKSNHAPTYRDFYVGRGSVLGNPFTSQSLGNTKAEFQAANKEDAIKKYEDYLELLINSNDNIIIKIFNEMLDMLKEGDINLVCYCAPKRCHAEIIKNKLLAIMIQKLMS